MRLELVREKEKTSKIRGKHPDNKEMAQKLSNAILIPDAAYSSQKVGRGSYCFFIVFLISNLQLAIKRIGTYAICCVEVTTFLLTNAGGAKAEADAKKRADATAVNFIFEIYLHSLIWEKLYFVNLRRSLCGRRGERKLRRVDGLKSFSQPRIHRMRVKARRQKSHLQSLHVHSTVAVVVYPRTPETYFLPTGFTLKSPFSSASSSTRLKQYFKYVAFWNGTTGSTKDVVRTSYRLQKSTVAFKQGAV